MVWVCLIVGLLLLGLFDILVHHIQSFFICSVIIDGAFTVYTVARFSRDCVLSVTQWRLVPIFFSGGAPLQPYV
jgi:hypothetical protein